MVRDTRKLRTNDWAPRLYKVTTGEHNNPIDEYLEGQAPASVKTTKICFSSLRSKMSAKYTFTAMHNMKYMIIILISDKAVFLTGNKITKISSN